MCSVEYNAGATAVGKFLQMRLQRTQICQVVGLAYSWWIEQDYMPTC